MRPPAAPRVAPKPVKPAVPARTLARQKTSTAQAAHTAAKPASRSKTSAQSSARPLPAAKTPAKTPAKSLTKAPTLQRSPAAAKKPQFKPPRQRVVSTAMGDRLAEKRAMSRHRIAKRIAITVALAAALAGLIWGAYFSPALMLDPAHVSVTGQGDTVNAAQVTAILSEQAGVPLPRVDTGDLRQQVEALNGVKEARIVRAWPRGLTAHLLARQPAAAVPAAGGYAIIDAEGVRVAVAPEPGEGLPIIVLPLIDGEPEAQAPAVQQPAALTAALTVLHALPEDLAADVRQVEVSTRDDVRTVLHSGQVIRWGDSTRLPVKLAVVRTLRDADPHSREFDVSAPEIPVTR